MERIYGYDYLKVPCIEVRQPIGPFYIAAIGYKELLHISYADTRKLRTHSTELEQYIGLQRLLSESRVKEIAKYVTVIDATFPTGVILQVDEYASREEDGQKILLTIQKEGETELLRNVQLKEENGNKFLLIRYDENIAKILDGQHRIEGLRRAVEELGDSRFELNVTVFIDMDIEDQAITFATINKSQTKVNKSLVSDLYEYAETRSPQKTAHNIARALNQREGSPFFRKIKILGVAEHDTETITQATFVESLQKYISGNNLKAMKDRDVYKRGGVPEKVVGKEAQRLFLRNLFIEKKDSEIASILWNYFSAVLQRWPNAWGRPQVDAILNKSTGFVALMKFLRDAYHSLNTGDKVPSVEQFYSIFERIDIVEDAFTKKNYIPGGIGQSALYRELKEKSNLTDYEG